MPTPVSATRTSTMPVVAPIGDVDAPAFLGELHGVADQVEEHLFEPADVAEHDRIWRGRELQLDPLGRGGGHHRLDDVPQQLAKVDLVALERQPPAGDAREIEQVVDQLCLPRRVVVNGLERACGDRGRQRALLKHRRPSEHRVERRAQVVRHDRDEFVLEAVGGFRLGAGASAPTRTTARGRAPVRSAARPTPAAPDTLRRT